MTVPADTTQRTLKLYVGGWMSNSRIEATCKKCGLTHYEQVAQLLARGDMKHLYLDEAERLLRCANRFCRGGVRISLIHDDKNEGFVGGMA